MSWRAPWISALLVGLLTLAAQLPSLGGGFVWDDWQMLVVSDLYTDADNLPVAWSHTLGMATNYWRPVATTSYLIDAEVLGGASAAFRGTQALLHALTAALLVAGLRFARVGAPLAVFAGLLFGWHPVTVEPASWISCRFDVLATLFSTIALLPVLSPWGRRRLGYGVIIGAAFLAMLSKEAAVTLPFIVAGGQWSVSRRRGEERPWMQAVRSGASAVAGIVAALLLRLAVLGTLPTSPAAGAEATGVGLERGLLVGRTLGVYVRALLVPWGGVGPGHYVERPIPPDDAVAWAGILLGTVLAALVLHGLIRGRAWAGWGVALAASLAPVLQLLPLDLSGGFIAADRFLYLPLVVACAGGASVVGAHWVDRPMAPARRMLVTMVACVTLLACVSYRLALIPRWADDRAMLEWMAEMAPDSPMPLVGLYDLVLRQDRRPDPPDLDLQLASRLVEGWPSTGYQALLAQSLRRRGRDDEALALLLEAPPIEPPRLVYLLLQAEPLLLFGHAAAAEERYRTALQIVLGEEASRFARFDVRALAGAAVSAGRIGDVESRDRRLSAAERLATEKPGQDGRGLLVLALVESGRSDAALAVAESGRPPEEEWLLAALRSAGRAGVATETTERLWAVRGPAKDRRVKRGLALGLGLGSASRWNRAAAVFRELTELEPNRGDLHDHLGYVLFGAGDPEGAERELRRAIELDGEHAWAHYHLGLLLDRTDRADEADGAYAKARSLATTANDRALLALLDDVTR